MLLRRLKREDVHVQELMRRLSEEYPGDIGIMMPLLLNYMRMEEGESFFMAANEPHAYLKGDIMEVRAGEDALVGPYRNYLRRPCNFPVLGCAERSCVPFSLPILGRVGRDMNRHHFSWEGEQQRSDQPPFWIPTLG